MPTPGFHITSNTSTPIYISSASLVYFTNDAFCPCFWEVRTVRKRTEQKIHIPQSSSADHNHCNCPSLLHRAYTIPSYLLQWKMPVYSLPPAIISAAILCSLSISQYILLTLPFPVPADTKILRSVFFPDTDHSQQRQNCRLNDCKRNHNIKELRTVITAKTFT